MPKKRRKERYKEIKMYAHREIRRHSEKDRERERKKEREGERVRDMLTDSGKERSSIKRRLKIVR